MEYPYFCQQTIGVMTAIELNAELARNMEIISEDENLLRRAVKYLRRLAREKQTDSTLLTKEEFFRRVDEGREQIHRGESFRFSNRDEMNVWLNSL